MSSSVMVWSDDLVGYDFGSGHPMRPVRLVLTLELMRALGVLEVSGLEMRAAAEAGDHDLQRVHTPAYIAAVKRAEADGVSDLDAGLGTEENPVFAQMHSASARLAGATLEAARSIWPAGPGDLGQAPTRALSLAGGMHHAMAGRASGFCVYNDLAVAISWLLDHGARRVAYVDLDAHHGDGVERAFWDDPRVLTVSVHQHPSTLFPGTGYSTDIGGAEAPGTAANVGLPVGTRDAAWLRAVDAVASPLVAHHAPDVLVTQHGCDCHGNDPLAGLNVSVDAQRQSAIMMSRLAADAGARWLATGGGGYDVLSAVPRAWSHLAAVVAGAPIDPQTPVPTGWRELVTEAGEPYPPRAMSDGVEASVVENFPRFIDGYNPEDAVDRAIMATRQAVFPGHGLDVLLD
ncbi:acetoin utilization protein AcuC [Bogoriella caseilytica]|uniref:Acetoin utilization protein AcuC n=1 Tax=Bogoriella caseilytica TaxID=56055 RepID=A0A3N2BAZ8_9MICO|nr:acetoin utilization protein AcuC [Bogoriella caseilytica]ROR72352.1 acetoin utilization protein AcuC [Bogoriella caseilytica]